MTYSRAVVERAGELRRSGLSCREIARELDGPSKSAVARWTRSGAAGGTVGRAVAKMDLPKVVGDGPVYPDIDPDDKDALIERLVLENAVLRAVNDVLKAASLDGMSNREKTLVIDRLRPAGKWSLRELTSSLGISKSSYEYQHTAIARPDRLAALRALVRRVFTDDAEGARGYRFETARLRELDEPVRASEKVVLRIMREEGLVPRWMRRKRRPYSSYAGEPTPAPPNLVRRDFRSALPNFLWLTDITEFRLPDDPRKVYLSPAVDLFDGDVAAFVAGVGTGGTISGVGRYLKEQDPAIRIVAMEPASSPLLTEGHAGPHAIQGIGANFVPEALDTTVYDEVVTVTDEAALAAMHELAEKEGLLCGVSSGAAAYAARELAKRPEFAGRNVVCLLPDTGERYLSIM